MENERSKGTSLRNLLSLLGRTLSTFMYVFFMLASIIIFTTEMRVSYWFLPQFVIPSCMVCITFGADYWVKDDPVRRWSYCISTVVATVLLVPLSLWRMSYDGVSTGLGLIATIVLPIFPILYGITLVRVRKVQSQEIEGNPGATQTKVKLANLRNVIRVLSMISICCVLLENGYRVLMILYHFIISLPKSIAFAVLVPFPLSILSAILLAKFMKAEFVQWKPSPDGVN